MVGAGITAIVARLDYCRQVQRAFGIALLRTGEAHLSASWSDHSGIVRYFGVLENAIILQFASQTSIRQYLARQKKQVPLSLSFVG